jgi:hypothetical protein
MGQLGIEFKARVPYQPLPLGARHYVPVLKSMKGELDALWHAAPAVRAGLTPLLEVPGRGGLDTHLLARQRVRGWVQRIASSVGRSSAVFLDFATLTDGHYVLIRGNKLSALHFAFDVAGQEGLHAVPVVRPGIPQATAEVVRDITATDQRGVCIRMPLTAQVRSGRRRSDALKTTIEMIHATPEHADLVLDLALLTDHASISAEQVASIIRDACSVGAWRNVVLVATTMPPTLGCIDEGTVGFIPRHEWGLFTSLAEVAVERMPIFGDYGIQGPKDPHQTGGPGMRANIRYTFDGETLIARAAGAVVSEGREQYVELCRWIVERNDIFKGPEFSWGDAIIEACADGQQDPGSQDLWRAVGTSHHIQFVTDQLRDFRSRQR